MCNSRQSKIEKKNEESLDRFYDKTSTVKGRSLGRYRGTTSQRTSKVRSRNVGGARGTVELEVNCRPGKSEERRVEVGGP